MTETALKDMAAPRSVFRSWRLPAIPVSVALAVVWIIAMLLVAAFAEKIAPYGFTVDVSAEVRRWRAFEKRLLKQYFRKKGIRARK